MQLLNAFVGAIFAGLASFAVTWFVINPDLSGVAAVAGSFIGAIGGALARIRTYQIAITAFLWGALLGPIVGLFFLVVMIAIAGVGM